MTSGSGKYAIIRRRVKTGIGVSGNVYFQVWNGTNNHLLTRREFDTPRFAREWAEENGYEIKSTKDNP